ncbi:MAG: MFS transporter [Acidimicrobiia bacterium]
MRASPHFRRVWVGRSISFFGAQLTMVAVPYQVFRITGSSLAVGLVGIAELIPLIATALAGGVLADRRDLRRLLLVTDVGLVVVSALYTLNATLPDPQLWLLYVLAAASSGLLGLNHPAFVALIPRIVARDLVGPAMAVGALPVTLAMVAGPAIAGALIAGVGLSATYAIDTLTFAASLVAYLRLDRHPPVGDPAVTTARWSESIRDGWRYLRSRPEIEGTYIIDFAAMLFGMPIALFPALALDRFDGDATTLGLLFAAPPVGAFVTTLLSGWAGRVHRYGRAIVIAVLVWGAAIVAFGFSWSLGPALAALAVAGGADMMSGVFRMRIWATIPDQVRGRLAGFEWLNVNSGPALGDLEAGAVASLAGSTFAIVSGGLLTIVGAIACATMLPGFFRYRRGADSSADLQSS